MSLMKLRNEKGFAMISIYMVSAFTLALAGSTFSLSFVEAQQVSREISRLQSHAAAEAGIQMALFQIGPLPGQQTYLGYINDQDTLQPQEFQNAGNSYAAGNYTIDIEYTDLDWVVIRTTGNALEGNNVIATTNLEARVYLNSDFSKYMMYADANVGLGTNLQLGFNDGINPQGVPQNGDDRSLMYYTGDLSFSGSNVQVYGDIFTQSNVTGTGGGNSNIHGDTYSWNYNQDQFGQINSGVNPSINVGDGFNDDVDRNGDGLINASDYPDHHQLTENGGGDTKPKETPDAIDLNWYATEAESTSNIEVVRIPNSATDKRFLKFEPDPINSAITRVVEYSSANFTNPIGQYSFNNKPNAIVYVDSNTYVAGDVTGRVTMVSSKNVYFAGDVTYNGGQHTTSTNQPASASFFAKEKLYFVPQNIQVSGTLYADNAVNDPPGTSPLAIDASKKFNSDYTDTETINPTEKYDGVFRHYGNIIMDGTANTSLYLNNRAYIYDPLLKSYRPPGTPVYPELRVVREA